MRRTYEVMFRLGAIAVVCLVASAVAFASTKPQLQVVQVTLPGSFYIEGSYSYFRVERLSGKKVVQSRLPLTKRPKVTVPLVPGRYRLRSWQRACDGNCGYLDPPSDRCSRTFQLGRQQQLAATIKLKPGRGCTISFK